MRPWLMGLGAWLTACASAWAQASNAPRPGNDGAEARATPRIVWQKEVTLPGGVDLGQHLATVLEVRSSAGAPLLAAGFVNGGQTSAINDHRALSFFVDASLTRRDEPARGDPLPALTMLPGRPFGATNLFNLLTHRGDLLAYLRSGGGPIRRWSDLQGAWLEVPSLLSRLAQLDPIVSLQVVGDDLLGVFPSAVVHGSQRIDLQALGNVEDIRFEAALYAHGRLFISALDIDERRARVAVLFDCHWTPHLDRLTHCRRQEFEDDKATTRRGHVALGMHPLADGQLLIYGLSGFLYLYRGGQLRPLVEIDPARSWQVYSSVERHGRLYLGQYPSGNLVQLSLAEHLSDYRSEIGWPDAVREQSLLQPPIQPEGPVRRDEAQSLMLVGDSLLVGMWPWGEVFRGRPGRPWARLIGSLTGQAPTADGLHPFEADFLNNCLGMRVFQIVPWRGGVAFQTTVKNEDPECTATLARASPTIIERYGRVHYLDVPGFLSCHLPWSEQPRRLRFVLRDDDAMAVESEGRTLCARRVPVGALLQALRRPNVQTWVLPALGLYGRRTPARALDSR